MENSSTIGFDSSSQFSVVANSLLQQFLSEFSVPGVLALAALPVLWMLFGGSGGPPVINPKKLTELTIRPRLLDFGRRSKEIFLEGRAKFQKNPYRVNSEWGDVVVLHPDFCSEIRNEPRMNFAIPASDVGRSR